MAKVQEGDRVRVVTRPVTDEDRAVHKFFEHMQGLTGTVTNYYNKDEVAVVIDEESLTGVPKEIQHTSTHRMREKVLENTSEELKKILEKDHLNFNPHYGLLLREQDLEKI